MNVLITCGPAWEPLDGMRRLTNASTGKLGSVLARLLLEAGHSVTVFRGDMATAELPPAAAETKSFGTNDDLARGLAAWSANHTVDVLLHAAALCDFKLAAVRDSDGRELGPVRKLSSRSGRLQIELEPATKVLPLLRGWFPKARIVGWKYELDGGRPGALSAAWRQFREANTDACVVNGTAWGEGFGWCEPPESVTPCRDLTELGRVLLSWMGKPM